MGLVADAIAAAAAASTVITTDTDKLTADQAVVTADQATVTTDTEAGMTASAAVYTALTTAPYTGTALVIGSGSPPTYQIATAVAPAGYTLSDIPLA